MILLLCSLLYIRFKASSTLEVVLRYPVWWAFSVQRSGKMKSVYGDFIQLPSTLNAEH